MDAEHKKEIIDEELREIREEPMNVWIEENSSELESEFINEFPPEDQPLDDDIPDFLDNYADELREFQEKRFNEADEQ